MVIVLVNWLELIVSYMVIRELLDAIDPFLLHVMLRISDDTPVGNENVQVRL